MSTFIVQSGGRLQGDIRVPGDKSISHRSIILGSLAQGRTHVTGFLEGEDSLHTIAAFQKMGVSIQQLGEGEFVVQGNGLHALQKPQDAIYLGNSGTAMRLMAGVLAGQKFASSVHGDASLSTRPMRRIVEPLELMGAKIESAEDYRPPLQIAGASLRGINYTPAVASAQIKSCILLAGLYADGETAVNEVGVTRDHTERMLRAFGYDVAVSDARVSVTGGGQLQGTQIEVPADISSAAFFLVGAAIASGSDITLRHVGVNATRTGVIDILRLMGAQITLLDVREIGGEEVADIHVRASDLQGIEVPLEYVPRAIDEFPALFIAAACAQGETIVRGAEELRVKESDRIQAMVDGLQILGIDATATPDGAIIQGGQMRGGVVDSLGDHRIAMAFSMAALRSAGDITIKDCSNVTTSFPGFAPMTSTAGLRFKQAS